MPQKLAVAIVHGIGKQDPNFHEGMKNELTERFREHVKIDRPTAEANLVVEPVYWAPALGAREERLWKQLRKTGDLDFLSLREFMVEFAADAIAYQPLPGEMDAYEEIHMIFAKAMRELAKKAGPDAPLFVIAHSLGTVIASNYFYDLQQAGKNLVPDSVKALMGDTALERGETLAWLVTMGSPIAIWSLRYQNPEFGFPIRVPAPQLRARFPALDCGWVNFYDEDDVIGYPLRTLNAEYGKAIKKDFKVNSGGWLSSWNPLSHNGYWTDNDVTKPIARWLAATWKGV